MGKKLKPIIFLIIILVVWQVISMLGIFNTYVLPTPQKVGTTFYKILLSGELFKSIGVSFLRVIQGFFIAFVLAFFFGMITFLFPKLKEYYDFYIQFFRNVPPLSLIPLLILWYGIGETTKIIIIVLASFFPMYLNIVKGFTSCDSKLMEVGKVFGYGKLECFYKISLLHALPDIVVGMRVGLGYSWRAIIGAEMIASSAGLGYMILFAQQMSRIDKVFVGIIVIGLVGYLCDVVFGLMIKRLFKGNRTESWS